MPLGDSGFRADLRRGALGHEADKEAELLSVASASTTRKRTSLRWPSAGARDEMFEHREKPSFMHEPAPLHSALDHPVMSRLGERLRGHYHLPATLPPRVYDLVTGLEQYESHGLVAVSRESRYRSEAVGAMLAAQYTSSSTAKTRLLNLAEVWIELAETAHKSRRL
jgi:hypothetical protein